MRKKIAEPILAIPQHFVNPLLYSFTPMGTFAMFGTLLVRRVTKISNLIRSFLAGGKGCKGGGHDRHEYYNQPRR